MAKAKKVDDNNKDFEKIKRIYLKFPSVAELRNNCTSEASLKEYFNTLYPNPEDSMAGYKLMRYIFATNRITLCKLSPENTIPKMGNLDPANFTQEYILTSHDPEREAIF